VEKVERLRNYDDLVRCVPWELFAALFFLVCGLMTQSAQAQSQGDNPPEANPGRPTVSTPATLTPAGYLQFESGFTGAANSPEFSSRYSLNEAMKLSVIKRLELVASAEPIVHSAAGGTTGNSAGEAFVGAQSVLHRSENGRPTLAVSRSPMPSSGASPLRARSGTSPSHFYEAIRWAIFGQSEVFTGFTYVLPQRLWGTHGSSPTHR
jgi:hypothetical protein